MNEAEKAIWDKALAGPLEVQPDARHWAGHVVRMVDGGEQPRQPSSFVLPEVEIDPGA